MSPPSVTRRQLLVGAGMGGAALVLGGVDQAAARELAQGPGMVTPPFVAQLAEYGSFPLPPEQATVVTGMLAPTLAVVRALNPPGYLHTEPASVFRVPVEA